MAVPTAIEGKKDQGEADHGRPVAGAGPLLSLDKGKRKEEHRPTPEAQNTDGDRVSRSREVPRRYDGGPAQGGRKNGSQNA